MSMAFFESKHAHLKNDYRDEDGVFTDSCGLTAYKLALLFRSEGKNPEMYAIYGARDESTGLRNIVEPLVFDGRVQWGAHAVCVLDGVAYDPMLESPEPFDDYLANSFKYPVEAENRTEKVEQRLANLVADGIEINF